MQRRPRVLHIIGGLQTGGAEALLFRLVTIKSPFEHHVIALAGRDWHTPLLEQHGIHVHHLNIRSGFSAIRALAKLDRLLGHIKPDVIQSWMYTSNLIAGLLGRRRGIPVVWGIHGSSLDGLGLATRLSARAGGLIHPFIADAIINCSTHSATVHAGMGYSKREATRVIHNGYDEHLFRPDEDRRNACRAQLEITRNEFVIGTIARWNRRKDVPNLINALGILSSKGTQLTCLLVGRDLDESNAELSQQMRSSGCEHIVVRLGERSDLDELARAMDLHVLPSATEAFPSVVAETMLSATPNVVTNVGDAALMVGDCGWVVPPNEPSELAAAIDAAHREWQGAPQVWQRRRTASRKRMVERFTLSRMAEAYADLWSDVIKMGN